MTTKQITETKGTGNNQAGTVVNGKGSSKTGNSAGNKTFEKIKEKSDTAAGSDKAGEFARKGIMESYNCKDGKGTDSKESVGGKNENRNAFMGMNPFAAGNGNYSWKEARVMY